MHPSAASHPRRAVLGALAALALLGSPAAFAGGMALTMQNGTHLGNAFSGAASAEDASTVYYNPAGLGFLEHGEVIAAASYVMLDARFTNDGSTTAGLLPTPGSNGGDAGVDKLIPVAYLAYPVSPTLTLGAGISAPFGLATNYSRDWVGRYQALKSELVTMNASLALGWKITPRVSLGLGIDHQSADAELSNAIDVGLIAYGAGIPGFAPGSADALARIRGDDTTTGFNVGALVEIADGTRVGVHYRSSMEHELRGRARFSDVPAPFAPVFADQAVQAALTLPEIFSVSLAHHLTQDLAVFADWSFWKWSRFRQLAVDFESPATPDMTQVHNWDDASIFSVGARWRRGERLTLRAGLAYNETPVPNAERRTARIPDSDRIWTCVGAGWQFNAELHGEIGFAHLFMDDARTVNDDGAGHVLVGRYKSSANIISAQLNWSY